MVGLTAKSTERALRAAETTGAYDGGDVGVTSGMLSGARVGTAIGWRSVDALQEGDLVLTFDDGLQPITKITRKPVWASTEMAPRKLWPLHVSAGALGNSRALDLLPNQYVMIESDAGEELFGDPFSLVNAQALIGFAGIDARPPRNDQQAVVIHFDGDQVIFDQSGVLYYCPSSQGLTGLISPAYKALAPEKVHTLMACIEADSTERKLWASEAVSDAFFAA